VLFNANFFLPCPAFRSCARREKTRESLRLGLAVFAEMAADAGTMKVSKDELKARSGLSERTLCYYGGVKGISLILRKTFKEGRARMTTVQVQGLGKIGIGAIEGDSQPVALFGYNDAMNCLHENLELAVRRTEWPAGHFLMGQKTSRSKRPEAIQLMLYQADGSEHPYEPSLPDYEMSDWHTVT